MRIHHLAKIAEFWNGEADGYCQLHPEFLEEHLHPSWGLLHLPEREIRIIADELRAGITLLELGCGCGHDAVAYANLGAEVVALDVSAEMLRRSISHRRVRYVLASAESIPLSNSSVDIAISDHGAFDYSPPPLLLKELHRVLKPNGLLAICVHSPLAFSCYNEEEECLATELLRPYPSSSIGYDGLVTSVEYSYSEWIRAFRNADFDIERLEEIRAGPQDRAYFGWLVNRDWAVHWPCDIIWKVRRNSTPLS